MSKKMWLLISILLIASLALGACGGAEPTEEPVVEPVETEEEEVMEPEEKMLTGTVTLWHSLKEGEIEGLNAAITGFQAVNPDVQFDILFVPFDDLKGKFETAAATGGGPSMMIGAADWGPALYNAELTADLGGMAELEFLQGINQAALGSVRYKGALVGLPLGLKGVVMFRNNSVMPEAAATFDDLKAKAADATAGDVLGANLEYGFFFAAAHLNGVGGQLMSENGDPAFNDEKGVEWFQNFP